VREAGVGLQVIAPPGHFARAFGMRHFPVPSRSTALSAESRRGRCRHRAKAVTVNSSGENVASVYCCPRRGRRPSTSVEGQKKSILGVAEMRALSRTRSCLAVNIFVQVSLSAYRYRLRPTTCTRASQRTYHACLMRSSRGKRFVSECEPKINNYYSAYGGLGEGYSSGTLLL